MLAEPLATPDAAAVEALDPAGFDQLRSIAAFKPTYEVQNPDLPYDPTIAMQASLCRAPLVLSTAAERVAVREASCLVLVLAFWRRYAETASDADLSRARTAYALAVASLGASSRSAFDAAIGAAAGAAQTPAGPEVAGIRSAAALLKERTAAVNATAFARTVLEAVVADPAFWEKHLAAWVSVGTVRVKDPYGYTPMARTRELDAVAAVCAHGHRGASDAAKYFGTTYYTETVQDACGTILVGAYRHYRLTAAPSDYALALAAYRLGVNLSMPCDRLHIIGSGCPAEWVDSLKRMLGAN